MLKEEQFSITFVYLISFIVLVVSFCNKVYPEDVGRDEANCHGLLDGENFQIQRQPSLSNDMETDLRIVNSLTMEAFKKYIPF